MNELTQLSKTFNEATPETQSQIVEVVHQELITVNPLASICDQINQKLVRFCPHCGKSHIILYGKRKAIQYYYCKDCKKHFNEFSGTTISYLKKKDLIKPFIFSMLSGLSLQLCSEIHHISIQTAFDWRHKILSSLRHFVPKQYCGITEMIQTEIPFSRKGQGAKSRKIGYKGKIIEPFTNNKAESLNKGNYKPLSIVAINDRTYQFEISIVQHGNLDLDHLKEQLNKKLNKVKKLCIEDQELLKQFAGKKKISYFVKKIGSKVNGCNKYYHTDNVQMKYFKLKGFMDRFHGVSSSYLQNYLNWYMILDHILTKFDASAELIERSISIPNGKEDYKKCKMFV